MKVAVVGGGFYGIMASLEAAKFRKVKEVYIFEKEASLMQAAGKYNQARLHLGFHYPRSFQTIKQTQNIIHVKGNTHNTTSTCQPLM